MQNLFTPNKIRTYTGKYINPFNPDPNLICIEDIAHALSMQCRFGGHTKIFYSVAEHSLWVAEKMVSKQNKLSGLLHDASEAYLLDIPSPIKKQMPEYKKAEIRLMEIIAKKFGLEWPLNDLVKSADMAALHLEWESFCVCENPPHQFATMSPKIAEAKFLIFYEENKLI